jgi:hypothetical protein
MFKLLTKVFASWKGQPDAAPSAADPATPPPREEAREAVQAAPAAPAQVADRRGEGAAPAGPDVPPPAQVDGAREEEQIRVRAYYLAEAAGFPKGRSDEFWHQAAREVRGAAGRDRNGATPARHTAPREVESPGR